MFVFFCCFFVFQFTLEIHCKSHSCYVVCRCPWVIYQGKELESMELVLLNQSVSRYTKGGEGLASSWMDWKRKKLNGNWKKQVDLCIVLLGQLFPCMWRLCDLLLVQVIVLLFFAWSIKYREIIAIYSIVDRIGKRWVQVEFRFSWIFQMEYHN